MDRFFPKITKDAYEAEMAKQSSAIIKSMEDQQERARQRIKDKEAELQARKRRNQQEVRARRKNAEILSGTRTSEGKRIPKRTSHTLLPHQRPTRYIDMPSVTRPPSSARTQRPCRINKPQKRTNWFSKTVWVDIQESAIRNRYSARHIANDLATRFPAKFSTLRDSTIQNWIEPKSSPPRWSNKVLEKIERGVGWVPGEGRIPLLDRAGYTELKEGFIEALKGMRQATLPVNAFIALNLLMGIIKSKAPHLLLERPTSPSTQLLLDSATHSGVPASIRPPLLTVQAIRRFLRTTLNWSVRVGTQAGQKLHLDWELQCEKAFFRLVFAVAHEKVHQTLVINLDQTGVNVIPGGKLRTYDEKGSKQIPLLGKEEKRAFTAVLGVTAAGQFLKTQVVWRGKTTGSLPDSELQEGADAEVSFITNERNHWSCLETMQKLIQEIVAPHREAMIAQYGLSEDAKVILYLDCWKVHKGKPFRTWILEKIPWVIIIFVPAGCTGILQPVDVGIARIYKHIVRQAAAEYFTGLVEEQMAQGRSPSEVRVSTSLPLLRNASVEWLVRAARHFRSKPHLCNNAWSNCKVMQWDFSWASITSPAARTAYFEKDSAFRTEIEGGHTSIPEEDEVEMDPNDLEDDVDTPLEVVESFTQLQTAQTVIDDVAATGRPRKTAKRARGQIREHVQREGQRLPEGYRYGLRNRANAVLSYKEDSDSEEESVSDSDSDSTEEIEDMDMEDMEEE